MGTATMRFGEGAIVTGSAGTDVHALVVTGSTYVNGDITCNNISIGADAAGTGRTISAGNTDTSIRFNSSDGVDIVVGGSFFVSCDENASQDTIVFNTTGHDIDFRVESNNKEYQLFSDAGNDLLVLGSDVDIPVGVGDDTNIIVSGSTDGQGQVVFTGNVVTSGSLRVSDAFTLPTTDGTANQVIKTDGSGNLTWTTTTVDTVMSDADGDTKIQVEESPDEDKIRFDTSGAERMIITDVGVGIGNSSFTSQTSDTNFFVSGSIKSKDSSATRGTAVFGGDLVVSGALYNDAGAEYSTVSTQLVRGQVILTADERLTHWSNQTVSATSILSSDEDDIRSWFFFPYSARIKKVYLIAKQNISDDVTCRIYLNKTVIHASGPNATQTKLSSEFGSVSQTFGVSTTFSYKKAVYNFTLDVPAESVMQMSFQKGDGASVSHSDNIVVVVYETSLLMF